MVSNGLVGHGFTDSFPTGREKLDSKPERDRVASDFFAVVSPVNGSVCRTTTKCSTNINQSTNKRALGGNNSSPLPFGRAGLRSGRSGMARFMVPRQQRERKRSDGKLTDNSQRSTHRENSWSRKHKCYWRQIRKPTRSDPPM